MLQGATDAASPRWRAPADVMPLPKTCQDLGAPLLALRRWCFVPFSIRRNINQPQACALGDGLALQYGWSGDESTRLPRLEEPALAGHLPAPAPPGSVRTPGGQLRGSPWPHLVSVTPGGGFANSGPSAATVRNSQISPVEGRTLSRVACASPGQRWNFRQRFRHSAPRRARCSLVPSTTSRQRDQPAIPCGTPFGEQD